MDVRVLRYFLAVAREQTISGAAEVLHMTQPPLSKQLRELEEELGKQLFYRGKRRITLTKEGMLLRKRAEEIVSLVEKTKAEVSASDEQITGDIHIGGGETESMRPIAQAVEQVQQRHPGLCVHFFSGDGYDVAERLDRASLILAPSLSRWRWASMTPSVCRARMCGGSSSAGTILWPGRRWFGRRIWRTSPSLSPGRWWEKTACPAGWGMTMRNCTSSPLETW